MAIHIQDYLPPKSMNPNIQTSSRKQSPMAQLALPTFHATSMCTSTIMPSATPMPSSHHSTSSDSACQNIFQALT